MRFAKMHGLGNDMILINGFTEKLPDDLGALALAICDRHLGVGADGMIILTPSSNPDAAALFRFFNSDGSESGMCGNGLRCAALFAKKEGITDRDQFIFDTISKPVQPTILDEAAGIVRVDMGEPRLLPSEIPADFPGSRVVAAALPVHTRVFYATLVSMGNPHCVIFVDDVDSFPVEKIGPQIERHALFPEQTNVDFVQRRQAEDEGVGAGLRRDPGLRQRRLRRHGGRHPQRLHQGRSGGAVAPRLPGHQLGR